MATKALGFHLLFLDLRRSRMKLNLVNMVTKEEVQEKSKLFKKGL